MAKAKSQNITITIKPEDIRGSEIMKSGDYKYARVGAKVGDDEYVSVSYEWKGEAVPDFVMSIMAFIQAGFKELTDEEKATYDVEYAAAIKRLAELESK